MNILDTNTEARRAFCREVQPEPRPVDPLAVVVRELALRGRHPVSVAVALVNLGICATVDEAEPIAKRYYPW